MERLDQEPPDRTNEVASALDPDTRIRFTSIVAQPERWSCKGPGARSVGHDSSRSDRWPTRHLRWQRHGKRSSPWSMWVSAQPSQASKMERQSPRRS